MLENALAALGVGLVRGLPLERLKERLEGVESIPGRLEIYPAKGGFTVAIDFAHSPDSLEKVLRFVRTFYQRVITVFGCGGDSDRLKRPLMGEISGRLSAYTILTSDNPKGEDPLTILQEIERGLVGAHPQAPYETIPDRRRAIERALELAQPGDCVLIAGKGHERFQVFRDKAVPFNDFECLVELGVWEPHGAPTA
jgi:UDP-N-acetylmuramoyl-L-alanyl-D-glutamate--2,6-diaminopimelate ligase